MLVTCGFLIAGLLLIVWVGLRFLGWVVVLLTTSVLGLIVRLFELHLRWFWLLVLVDVLRLIFICCILVVIDARICFAYLGFYVVILL